MPAGTYLLKVNNTTTRTRCEIRSTLTIKTPERRLNFEHVISDWGHQGLFRFKDIFLEI